MLSENTQTLQFNGKKSVLICLLTVNILSSSTDAISLGIDDTPVSLLANTLSDPANDDVNVALLSENITMENVKLNISYLTLCFTSCKV